MVSTTAGSRATSVTVRPALAAACASAVPQAPAPMTVTRSSGIDGHARRIERPARPRLEVEPVAGPQRQPFGAGPGDHGAIVGAERCRRDDETGASHLGDLPQRPADAA